MYTQPTAEILNRHGSILPKNAAKTVEEWEHGFPVCMPIGGLITPIQRPPSLRKGIPKIGTSASQSNNKVVVIDEFLSDLIDNNHNSADSIYKDLNPMESLTMVPFYSSTFDIIVNDSYPKRNRNTISTPFLNRGLDKRIFKRNIAKSVADMLENSTDSSNWSLETGWKITDKNLVASANTTLMKHLRFLRNLAGDPYRISDAISIVRNRLFSGELPSLDIDYIIDLFDHQQTLVKQGMLTYYHKSGDTATNYLFAKAYMQLFFRSLDYKAEGITAVTQKIIKRKPSRSVDVFRRLLVGDDTFLPVTTTEIIPVVNSDGTSTGLPVDGLNTLTLVNTDGRSEEYELASELNRAFFLSEKERTRTVELLGGNSKTTLTASSSFTKLTEFRSNLNLDGNHDRDNYYIFKLDMTKNNEGVGTGPLLSQFSYDYSLLESTDDISDWVTDKVSMGVYFIHHDDLIIDHFIQSKTCRLFFRDVDLTSLGPKDNPEIPLYSRVFPTTIVIIPTDKTKYNLFNSRSRYSAFSREYNIVERSLDYTTVPDQRIGDSSVMDILAVNEVVGYKVDTTFNGTEALYTDPISVAGLARGKSGSRVLFEIVQELKTNYNLEGGLSWYDIISRMKQSEYYTAYFLDNCELTHDYLRRGGMGAKIFDDFKKDAVIKEHKTRLKSKKNDAVSDNFLPIKGIPMLDRKTGNPIGEERDNYNLIKPPTESLPPTVVSPVELAQSTYRDTLTTLVVGDFAAVV